MNEMTISIARDVAEKLKKLEPKRIFAKSVDWCKQPCEIRVVPNQPDINNRVLSVRVSREFYRRLQKEAAEKRMGFNEYIRWVIWKATESVPLTKDDYELIERERQQDLKRSSAKGRVS